jgi:hypothetical protein
MGDAAKTSGDAAIVCFAGAGCKGSPPTAGSNRVVNAAVDVGLETSAVMVWMVAGLVVKTAEVDCANVSEAIERIARVRRGVFIMTAFTELLLSRRLT